MNVVYFCLTYLHEQHRGYDNKLASKVENVVYTPARETDVEEPARDVEGGGRVSERSGVFGPGRGGRQLHSDSGMYSNTNRCTYSSTYGVYIGVQTGSGCSLHRHV